MRLVADSALLSQHHASRAPAVAAAPASSPLFASSPPAHGWKREAVELRALLLDMREQLNALLATRTVASAASDPPQREAAPHQLSGMNLQFYPIRNANWIGREYQLHMLFMSAGPIQPGTQTFRLQPLLFQRRDLRLLRLALI